MYLSSNLSISLPLISCWRRIFCVNMRKPAQLDIETYTIWPMWLNVHLPVRHIVQYWQDYISHIKVILHNVWRHCLLYVDLAFVCCVHRQCDFWWRRSSEWHCLLYVPPKDCLAILLLIFPWILVFKFVNVDFYAHTRS